MGRAGKRATSSVLRGASRSRGLAILLGRPCEWRSEDAERSAVELDGLELLDPWLDFDSNRDPAHGSLDLAHVLDVDFAIHMNDCELCVY